MTVGVAVVGLGRWGPNHVRNLLEIRRCRLHWVCDSSRDALGRALDLGDQFRGTTQLSEVLEDPAVAGVVIATPASSHEAIAVACLNAGKHVLVEKPLGDSLDAAVRILDAAQQAERRLLVGHICVHHPGVSRIHQIASGGTLGDIRTVTAERTSLPPSVRDVSVLWDLAVHDLSILDYWLESSPLRVAATGSTPTVGAPEETVYSTLFYPGGVIGHIASSWAGPLKVRRCRISGVNAVATFDDLAGERAVTIDDGRVSRVVHELDRGMPLRRELDHFLDVVEGEVEISPIDGGRGVGVVRTLSALERSLREGGRIVSVD